MGDSWSCMTCFEPPPQPTRKRIDRNMIGLPTNFQHTGHIGSSEFGSSNQLSGVQGQMESKGGYEVRQEVPPQATPSGNFVGSYEH